jgi:hypothetical protein
MGQSDRSIQDTIWKAEVHPKVKVFTWRVATETLAMEKNKFSRNRLSSCYINIATTRYNELAGAAAQTSPKGKKGKAEKQKRNKEKKIMTTTSGRRKR